MVEAAVGFLEISFWYMWICPRLMLTAEPIRLLSWVGSAHASLFNHGTVYFMEAEAFTNILVKEFAYWGESDWGISKNEDVYTKENFSHLVFTTCPPPFRERYPLWTNWFRRQHDLLGIPVTAENYFDIYIYISYLWAWSVPLGITSTVRPKWYCFRYVHLIYRSSLLITR